MVLLAATVFSCTLVGIVYIDQVDSPTELLPVPSPDSEDDPNDSDQQSDD